MGYGYFGEGSTLRQYVDDPELCASVRIKYASLGYLNEKRRDVADAVASKFVRTAGRAFGMDLLGELYCVTVADKFESGREAGIYWAVERFFGNVGRGVQYRVAFKSATLNLATVEERIEALRLILKEADE